MNKEEALGPNEMDDTSDDDDDDQMEIDSEHEEALENEKVSLIIK